MSSTVLGRLLVVDDEFQLLDALAEALTAQGYEVHGFQTGFAAIEALQSQEFDLLLTDLMMPGMDGVTLLKACMSIDPNLVGIIMTGQGTVATAVEAMRSGAFDYVLKPFRLEVLLPVLARASEVRRLRLENIQLRETVAIYNLSQTIALSLDAKLVLENTADAALQQTGADEVSIMLLRPENNELYVAVVRGRDREYLLGQHIYMEESIAAWVARQSEPLILNGEVSDPRFAPVQPRPEILSAISIPMMTAGKLIGVLNVNNLQARRSFTAGQVKALSILSNAVAAAVENDALFHALEASEKRFRSLIENAPDGIALLGLDGKLQQVTLSTQQILGYTLEEAVGQDPALLTHPDDLPNLLGLLNDLIQNPGKVIHTEYRFRHKDGSWRWLESTISNLISEPSVAAIVFNYRDITKRKRAEQALQESETRFRSLIENSSDEISIVSADGSLLYESPSANPTLGYQPGEFLGKNLFQLVHPDDQARIQREFEELLHDPTLHPRDRFRLLHNNGTWRWVEVLGTNLLDEPSVRGIVVNYHDVTDRVHAEEQIQYQALIAENVLDAVVATNNEGIIKSWNKAAEGMFGYSSEEVIGKLATSVMNSEYISAGPQEVSAALRDTGSWMGEVRVFRKDGRVVYSVASVSIIWDSMGKDLGYLSVNHDITERKQAEEAVRESERQMKALVTSLDDIVFEFDVQGTYLNVWAADESLLARPKTALLGRRIVEILGEEEGRPFADGVHRVLASGISEDIEYSLAVLGGLRWFLARINPIRVQDGSYRTASMLVRDITQRKQAEEAVRESEEQYRSLFEDSPISLWVEDFSEVKQRLDQLKKSGIDDISTYLREHPNFVIECANHVRILDVNSAAIKLYHARNKSELVGILTDILPALPHEHFEHELIQLANGQLNFEQEGIDQTLTKEKIYVNVRWSVAPLHKDSLEKVIISTVDITERKRAEEQTQLQLQRIKALRAIDLAISSSFDLRLTLDIMLDQVSTQLKTDAAVILLFHPSTRTLEYAASRGFRSTAIRETRLRLEEGYAGKAVLERRLVHISNLVETDSELTRALLLKGEDFIEYYCVPLIVKGEVKGVLEIFHRSALVDDPEWVDFLETLAGQAAIAIENAALFEDLQHSNSELFQAYDATIEGWSHALDLRDKETEGHSQRVTEMTLKLAHKFDFTDEQLRHIRWGALLHDIGKMGVPDNILLKPNELTDEEWQRMKQHPVFALEMLSPITYLKSSLDIPYCHHEKWDGTGYPRGLKGEVIPLAARLFAIVDVWDALRSDRPYRKAWTIEKTLERIKSLSGTHFDPQVVEYFLDMVE